jgi:Tfp pilus assembly protein PilV
MARVRLQTGSSALADDRGSMLVEALVAAVLLVVLAVAFFSSLDGAANSSASNRHRSVAAALAQSEMERMRAMKQFDPADLSTTRSQQVGSVTYTISSAANWVDDASGSTTCGPGSSGADYLKVSTTVTWPTMGNVKPIKSESLFAVPAGLGSIKSQVVGRSGAAMPGIQLALAGPRTGSGTTDTLGCLFFGYLPVGSYTATVNQAGYVDKTGAQSVAQTTSVANSATSSLVYFYDRAAALTVSFDTKIGAAAVSAALGKGFQVANSNLPAPNTRAFTSGSAAASISSGSVLFPFSDGYAVYGGSCAANDPRAYGQAAPIVAVNPAATSSVTVRLPALNIVVKTSAGALLPTANVRITPPSGCGSVFTAPLSAAAVLTTPAQPYGDYGVCANNVTGTKRKVTATVQNRLPTGSAVTTLTVPSTGTSATCP